MALEVREATDSTAPLHLVEHPRFLFSRCNQGAYRVTQMFTYSLFKRLLLDPLL